jgi:CubicO group peptidase (beta-lactamase class C family)
MSGKLAERATEMLEDGVRRGWHMGAQLYVSQFAVPLVDVAVGQARPRVEMSTSSLSPWICCTKPVMAVAFARLWEQGVVGIDDPLVAYLPEFTGDRKESVTFRHVLTHTAGFSDSVLAHPVLTMSWDEAVRFAVRADLRPDWIPGERAAYSPWLGWLLLGEVLRRLDGRMPDKYLREEIFLPLGMEKSRLTIPPDLGMERDVVTLYVPAHNEFREVPLFGQPTAVGRCWPGGGARGPVRELGMLFEALLSEHHNGRKAVIGDVALAALTATHRTGVVDEMFDDDWYWGLGFMVDRRAFAPECSVRTFGHFGFQTSVVFADPVAGIVCAVVFNGMPGYELSTERKLQLIAAIYEEVEIPEPIRSSGGKSASGRSISTSTVTWLKASNDAEVLDVLSGLGGWEFVLHAIVAAMCECGRRSITADATLLLRLISDGSVLEYLIECAPGEVRLHEGHYPANPRPELIVECSPADFIRMTTGALDALVAVRQERLKFDGDLGKIPSVMQLTLTADFTVLPVFRELDRFAATRIGRAP